MITDSSQTRIKFGSLFFGVSQPTQMRGHLWELRAKLKTRYISYLPHPFGDLLGIVDIVKGRAEFNRIKVLAIKLKQCVVRRFQRMELTD